MEAEGLVILPTHRLVVVPLRAGFEAALAERFTVEPVAEKRAPRAAGEIDCVLPPDRRLRLRPRAAALASVAALPAALRTLDVSLLHRSLLEPLLGIGPESAATALAFTHDDAEAAEAVRAGRATAAFCLNPPSLAAVRAVCLAGQLMPEKSTYFWPKLASGLLFDLVGPPWT
jgi:uncharacterized protein (DUF1015 family)